ncbi:MAG TPA: MlaD family protein [Pirellulales bacterium]|jgi:phospholipid/cholesterol/gamma-HCH transport system substrate-binding protein|nr:MlaD family protein [Pirellulales bacterium]
MNERVIQFRVGVTVVAAIIIALLLVLLFDGFPEFIRARPYIIYISFNQAPGVTEGTPVRKSGILIGRVKAVDFAEDIGIKPREGLHVIVTCEIQADRTIRNNEVPQIGKSLLGDAVIEFVLQEDSNLPDTVVTAGERVPGTVTADPLQAIGNIEGNLSIAIGSIGRTADEIGQLAQRVNDLLANNDEQMVRIVGKAETALDQFQAAVTNANDLLGDPMMKQNIRQVVTDLPKATADLNEAMGSLKVTLDKANRNLTNIEGFTKPLGERGPKLINDIDTAATSLRAVMEQTRVFTTALNSNNGSLGQLMNDPVLYNNLNSAVTNINQLSYELKPIVGDVRAFSDKISRHPEKLGIRGALFPSSGIK